MTSEIHFITRHTRADSSSLGRIQASIQSLAVNSRWFIVGTQPQFAEGLAATYRQVGTKPVNDWGLLINHYLDNEPDIGQWVYLLDDDNLAHPNLDRIFSESDPDCHLCVFSQQTGPATVRVANPNRLVVQAVDAAQFCATRRLIGDLRLWNIYRSDGYFLMELDIRAREQGCKVQVFQEVMSFYNAQHWL